MEEEVEERPLPVSMVSSSSGSSGCEGCEEEESRLELESGGVATRRRWGEERRCLSPEDVMATCGEEKGGIGESPKYLNLPRQTEQSGWLSCDKTLTSASWLRLKRSAWSWLEEGGGGVGGGDSSPLQRERSTG